MNYTPMFTGVDSQAYDGTDDYRSPSGNAWGPDPQIAQLGTDARVRHRQVDRASRSAGPARRRRIALSRAPSSRGTWPRDFAMGAVRYEPPGEDLQAHGARSAAVAR